MKVDGSSSTYAQLTGQNSKLPAESGKLLPLNKTQQPNQTRSIDMNNLGLNELNALIQATGDERLLFRLPHDTFKLVNGGYQGSQSTDFLSQVENEISFERSLGNKTTELESFLQVLKGYQGYPLQPSIDATA